MPPLKEPTVDSNFTINSAAGIAGFFGGDEAIQAMKSVHLYRGRRWLGWFNGPGNFMVAKHFGRIANTRFWDGLFPGPNDSPVLVLGLDGKQGPKCISALSELTMQRTGHFAHLIMDSCKEIRAQKIPGRVTLPIPVGYLAMKHVNYEDPVELMPLRDALLGLIPIAFSIVASIICLLLYDWYCFLAIVLSVVTNGLATFFIGRGRLVLRHVNFWSAKGSPPAHSMLYGEDGVVVIKGKECDVNAITAGCFDIEMNEDKNFEDENELPCTYQTIGLCCLLLLCQPLYQLLLFPQGTLMGQIVFLVSLGVSWGYNTYLSSLEREKIQTRLLFRRLGNPTMLRFEAGTRTTAAVFTCLLLFHKNKDSSVETGRENRENILHSFVPGNTALWRRWNVKVIRQLMDIDYESKSLPHLVVDEEDERLDAPDRTLLQKLLGDAASAFEGYFKVYKELPDDSTIIRDV